MVKLDMFELAPTTQFTEGLQKLVVMIYNNAVQQLETFYANELKNIDPRLQAVTEDLERAGYGLSAEHSLLKEKEEQLRALATMALAMLATLIDSFLDEARTVMAKTHPPTNKRYAGKSVLMR